MEAKFNNGAVPMINDLLEKAASLDASDIHIEPGASSLRVRYRVDGLLQPGITIHRSMQQQIISRIKILGEMDISEQRLPQDGRTFIRIGNREFDLRISTIPAIYGEKAVIRLLDRKRTALPLEELGIPEEDLSYYTKQIEKPQGLILVCGPTGCGKTTTLYSSLEKINRDPVNIVTIEDPVEYQLPKINQIQVNYRTGLTFAKGLRAVLRQDPDVIMVGEIRDNETAAIAIQAAMTGHLVFSTLHTNDSASSIVRLMDMGIEPYLISSTLKCAVAQRLVRKSCETCKGAGCRSCNQTGYRGRTGIFEMLKIDDGIRKMIDRKASSHELAGSSGFRRLAENAEALVKNGITSREEVVRSVHVE
jgi:type II secretory ATPase GspE/PulE/Tfp pilus assembly ATPase PilB-like protein